MKPPKIPRYVDGDIQWQCSRCREWVAPAGFYQDKRRPNGLKAQCKKCHSEGNMRTRDPDLHRKARREHAARSFAANPDRLREIWRGRPARSGEKVLARRAVHSALRSGSLARPEACEECSESSKRLTAHHADYSKPLDVRWLCYLCHAGEHRMDEHNRSGHGGAA